MSEGEAVEDLRLVRLSKKARNRARKYDFLNNICRVRNLKDKSKVEMMCVGRKDHIRAFVRWMKICGDDASKDVGFRHVKTQNRRVDKVTVTRRSLKDLDISLDSTFVRRKTPP